MVTHISRESCAPDSKNESHARSVSWGFHVSYSAFAWSQSKKNFPDMVYTILHFVFFFFEFNVEVGPELAVDRVKQKVAVCCKHSRFVFGRCLVRFPAGTLDILTEIFHSLA